MGWLREADTSSMWGYTAEHIFSHLMDDITPAFARPDAIVNNVSTRDVSFESNHRSSDGENSQTDFLLALMISIT